MLIRPHNFLKSGKVAILIQFIKRGSVTSYHIKLGLLFLYFEISLGQAIPSVVTPTVEVLGYIIVKVSLKTV